MNLGLDVETSRDYDKKGSLRSVQIYYPQKRLTYVAHRTKEMAETSNLWNLATMDTREVLTRLDRQTTTEALQKLLRGNQFVPHNGSFDCGVCWRDLDVLPILCGDSFALAALLPWPVNQSRSLDAVTKKMIDPTYDKHKYGSWEDFDWDLPLPDNALLYAARDAWASYVDEEAMRKKYPRYAGFSYKLEVALFPVLGKASRSGIWLDKKKFLAAIKYQEKILKEKTDKLARLRGAPVRPTARADISAWLFDELQLEPKLKTKSGAASTSEEALSLLTHPVIEHIREAKKASTVHSSLRMMNSAQLWVEERDGLLKFEPQFKSCGAGHNTARLVTKDPAVHQWNWVIRQMVVPDKIDHLFLYADICQFELMVAAYAARENSLIQTYLSGGDVHQEVADQLGKDRETAKAVEYSAIFGSEGAAAARQLGISLHNARDIVSDFMDRFPRIAELRKNIHAKVLKSGLAYTAFGRARRLPEARSKQHWIKAKACRQAFNYFCQSTAGEIAKYIIANLEYRLPEGCSFKFSVYDSFLIQIPDISFKEEVEKVLEDLLTVSVGSSTWKFLFKSGVGKNWKEAKENAEAPGRKSEKVTSQRA